MNIRSITLFADVTDPLDLVALQKGADAVMAVKLALEDVGYTVQTKRLATQPFPSIVSTPEQAVVFAKTLENEAAQRDINYTCLGPVSAGDPRVLMDVVPDILAATSSTFLGVEIASRGAPLNLPLLKAIGELIHSVAAIGDDGFANLRLAALACVPPWGPFFPSGYHGGGDPRIAIATESADLAVGAVQSAQSVKELSINLIEAVERHAREIEAAVSRGLAGSDVAFQGIDFSLAPYPDQARSIGASMEALGVPFLGGHGTLMGAAWLTSTLDRARFTRTGFCGLMLPVLEDVVLAGRTSEGYVRVSDLLMYSAVCGTGLDTVPLPGDTNGDTIAAVLADVAGLALRLDKPLTARLMPLPGKQAGDPVSFEFEFFAPGRVMEVSGGSLRGLLARSDAVEILPRPIE